ncbi:response regulator [Ruminiclostridium cellobioparum]|uniref:LM5578_1851 family response regulator n=1 Tax=Ruminiclostridium cellobioparum TaxID=29355 RepID=UPI00055049F6|nr:response regulator [Ruminiclostridium cellobioparum]
MEHLKGVYIEDEMDNVTIYTSLFEIEGLDLECINPLPNKVDGFYDLILERKADFLIIDNHLDKQVTYKGIDVLREIRKHDSTIYAVLLTNYPLENFADQFGDYDYELQKDTLNVRYVDVAEKIKRACALRDENMISESMVNSSVKEKNTIELLKRISSQLDNID